MLELQMLAIMDFMNIFIKIYISVPSYPNYSHQAMTNYREYTS